MLLECSNRVSGSIDSVIVEGDEVGVNLVALDVCFDSHGTLIVHNVEHQ